MNTVLTFKKNDKGQYVSNEAVAPDADGNMALQFDYEDNLKHNVHILISVDGTHFVTLEQFQTDGDGICHLTGLMQGEKIKVMYNSDEKLKVYALS